ncbi:hypothetical protein H8356DRAFT_1653835 [Neocallimastix lanati (nom. inval.)]|jgi:hypothetical protein|uniref:Uncharacterized protein n=1 Tax=Neocallimastix californiae TaxID=1754190 RepID=A0A1Y2AP77_9FUNG|nr:hypothetical protein H8356DRAFT_1653835 [Neocallimastix sp. JGI-2020a]ORY24100.1 hypothetical protein LY90DRAFT_706683 [Neocallimastix californiae]|eukprot:ORY24100.1 hypothetical protein LY90DRAFT_706683 [Neocallimastix californiae]
MESMKIDKNSQSANTCYRRDYINFFQGINNQTRDTFFFSYIIQFILVAIMYHMIGKGKYWKVLFYSSVAGLLGSITENSTVAYICQISQHDIHGRVIPFLIGELFWIISEYSVPILNLIKIEAFSRKKAYKIIKTALIINFIPFAIARIYDGYDRMMKGYLNTKMSRICHGVAFGAVAVSDMICTIYIISFVNRKYNRGSINNSGIASHMKSSSYTILIAVDIVGFTLSVLYIISTLFPKLDFCTSITVTLHCFKSVFILILATDALVFKYGVQDSNSSNNSSSNINSRGAYSDYYSNNNSNPHSNNNNQGKNSFAVDVINTDYKKNSRNTLINSSAFYSSVEKAHCNNNYKEFNNFNYSVGSINKPIIKKYTKISSYPTYENDSVSPFN